MKKKGTNIFPKLYEHDGESLTLRQWGERSGINYHTLYSRIGNGWTIARALSSPAVQGAGGRAIKVTKNELELELDMTPLESLAPNLRKLVKEYGYKGTKFGKLIREMYRGVFDRYFDEVFLPHKLSSHDKTNAKSGSIPQVHQGAVDSGADCGHLAVV